jgi:hypothetical protein
MGAYTNPKLYGLDFSVITENTSEAAAKIAYATAKQQEERAKREKEFKDSYKDFISKAYLEANDYLGEEYRNTLNASLQDIENFSNMTEADKQNIVRTIQDDNTGTKEIAAKMPELATIDIDINKYDDPSVRLLAAMAKGDKNAFKSVKDPNNPMGINWQLTEKDPITGESKTYDISMRQLRMSMASLQDISPRIDAVDNELSALAGQYQKNIDSFATRGARFDWDSKFSEYFKGMDEEELDLYYRNAFPEIRGVDYTPNINPVTNQTWGDSDEEQAEKERLYNEKRQDLEARLKQKITGLLADTPISMTERERLAIQSSLNKTYNSDKNTTKQKSVGEVIPLGNAAKLDAGDEAALREAIDKLATRLLAGAGAQNPAGSISEGLKGRITKAILNAQKEGNSALELKGDVVEVNNEKYNIQDAFFIVNPGTGLLELHWDSYAGSTPEEASIASLPSAY